MRLGILTSHPIQYQVPWFRALAQVCDLEVFFAHRQTAAEQGKAGFGVAFEWDVDLMSGFRSRFLRNVAREPSVNRFRGCDTPEVYETIPAGGFDALVVTGWYLKTYLQGVRACRRARVPVLVRGDSLLQTPRSLFKRFAKAVIYRGLLRQFDGFLTVGQRNMEYLQHYGVPEDRIFSSPHFVDNDWFAKRAAAARQSRTDVRKQWGASGSTFVVLFVGKFLPNKRPADVLHALGELRTLVPDAIAVFVGAGELTDTLRATARMLGVAAHFAGFKNQSELPQFYAAADVLVLPSESETWGLVVNEAMACGLPAIVSDTLGCAPDLIDEGKTGFTYPMGNLAQLANRFERICALRRADHDFAPALAAKLRHYNVEAATSGTVRAVETLRTSVQR